MLSLETLKVVALILMAAGFVVLFLDLLLSSVENSDKKDGI